MKKITALILAVCAALALTACNERVLTPTQSSIPSITPSSSETSVVSEPEVTSSVPEPYTPPETIPEKTAMQKSAVLYCVEDDEILAEENTEEYIATASLLKVLTASVALHYVSSDKVFTVGTEQLLVPPHSSLALVQKGHKLSLYDLITGMLLPSGNDAAYTVAVSVAREVGGSDMSDKEAVEYFTDLMNRFAWDLGARHSNFTTPDGSDDENQYSTVSDMLLIAKYAITVPEIREISALSHKDVTFASGEWMPWDNSNKLINPNSEYYCPEAIGLKTGSTDDAGLNLIAVFKHNDKTYIVIVTGCESISERYTKVMEYYDKIDGVQYATDL